MSQPWHAVYPPHLPQTADYPDLPLWGLLARAARTHPDRPALASGSQSWSYADLWRRAGEIAEQLQVAPGQRVLLCLPNSLAFVTHYYGALRAGAIVTTASPALSPAELAAQIDDAEPAYIIDAGGIAARQTTDEQGPAEVAVLQYTSGTTAQAKGAMMTHRNLVANALQNARWFGWSADEVNLAILPLCHTWGMCCCLNSTVAVGGLLVLDPDPAPFAARRVFELVAQHRATVLYGSATMFHRLLDEAQLGASMLTSLRHAKAGAMLTQGQLKQRWDAFCPHAPLQQGYGLTEASPESHNNPPDRFRPGTVGVPLQDTDCRIADPEDPRRILAAGEPGEVQLRGPQITLGYWRRPEATAAALVDGGWLRTGDIGQMDDAGYLTIVDRMKDLLKFRGYSIAPNTIEQVLLSHPAVREAVVVGRLDEIDGDIPTAFIVADRVPESELLELCRERLARYEIPRAIHVVDEIPKNLVGKPLRRKMRERLQR